jgi:hypothetical protein
VGCHGIAEVLSSVSPFRKGWESLCYGNAEKHKLIKIKSKAVIPKVGCTAPWGAVGLPRGALEVGPSERVVRLFTTDQITERGDLRLLLSDFRPDIGKLVSLHQAHPSH